jgi:uncharacterized protein (DUF488 family)
LKAVYTIGHSTRRIDELIAVLRAHKITALVDIRSYPGSRRLPQFNRESLERSLPEAGIRYVWEKRLGGRRKKILSDSPNTGLRNDSFRNYADHMLTAEFQQGATDVLKLAEESPTAIMCAERMWFQCHRMLVSDYYVANGVDIRHIDAEGPARPHKLTKEARIIDARLVYRAESLF